MREWGVARLFPQWFSQYLGLRPKCPGHGSQREPMFLPSHLIFFEWADVCAICLRMFPDFLPNIVKHHQILSNSFFLQNSPALDVGANVSKFSSPRCQAGHLEANHTGNVQTSAQTAALWLQGHNWKANNNLKFNTIQNASKHAWKDPIQSHL